MSISLGLRYGGPAALYVDIVNQIFDCDNKINSSTRIFGGASRGDDVNVFSKQLIN